MNEVTFTDPITNERITLTITPSGMVVGDTVLSNKGLTEFIDLLTEYEL